MLAEIELPDGNYQPRTFSLTYYRTDGTKGSKAAVRKGGLAGAGPEGSSAFRYKAKEKGSLQLLDCTTNQYFQLKISLLTEYNGLRILHEEMTPPARPVEKPAQSVMPEPEPAPRRVRRRYRAHTEE